MSDRDEEDTPGEDVTEQARLTEEITQRLEAGEAVAAGFVDEEPACAGPIRRLLPTLRTMVAVGKLLDREEGSQARSRRKETKKRCESSDANPGADELAP